MLRPPLARPPAGVPARRQSCCGASRQSAGAATVMEGQHRWPRAPRLRRPRAPAGVAGARCWWQCGAARSGSSPSAAARRPRSPTGPRAPAWYPARSALADSGPTPRRTPQRRRPRTPLLRARLQSAFRCRRVRAQRAAASARVLAGPRRPLAAAEPREPHQGLRALSRGPEATAGARTGAHCTGTDRRGAARLLIFASRRVLCRASTRLWGAAAAQAGPQAGCAGWMAPRGPRAAQG